MARTDPSAPPAGERILRAAIDHVGREGVRGLRVEQIAREAGVSTPLVYHYFAGRAGLVRAALTSSPLGPPADDDAESGGARERVLVLLLDELDGAERESAVLRNELAASAVFDPALSEALAAASEAREAAVAAALRAGVEAGELLVARPDVTARALVAVAAGLRERWLGGVTPLAQTRRLLRRAVDRAVDA